MNMFDLDEAIPMGFREELYKSLGSDFVYMSADCAPKISWARFMNRWAEILVAADNVVGSEEMLDAG